MRALPVLAGAQSTAALGGGMAAMGWAMPRATLNSNSNGTIHPKIAQDSSQLATDWSDESDESGEECDSDEDESHAWLY